MGRREGMREDEHNTEGWKILREEKAKERKGRR